MDIDQLPVNNKHRGAGIGGCERDDFFQNVFEGIIAEFWTKNIGSIHTVKLSPTYL